MSSCFGMPDRDRCLVRGETKSVGTFRHSRPAVLPVANRSRRFRYLNACASKGTGLGKAINPRFCATRSRPSQIADEAAATAVVLRVANQSQAPRHCDAAGAAFRPWEAGLNISAVDQGHNRFLAKLWFGRLLASPGRRRVYLDPQKLPIRLRNFSRSEDSNQLLPEYPEGLCLCLAFSCACLP